MQNAKLFEQTYPGGAVKLVTSFQQFDRRAFMALLSGTISVIALKNDRLAGAETAAQLAIPGTWGFGQLLAFSALDGNTDYKNGLVARTLDRTPGIEIVFPQRMVIQFGNRRIGEVQLTNDTFHISTENGLTRGAFVDAHHILCEGSVTPGPLPSKLQIVTRGARTLIATKANLRPEFLNIELARLIESRQAWLRRQAMPRGLYERRRRTFSKALCVMKSQVCSAEGLLRHRWTTPDRWPHRDLWLWDSAFHAIGWRHVDSVLAREIIESVFDAQQPDGRVPHQANPLIVSSITQPPVLALAVELVAGKPLDLGWIEKVYPHLTRYLNWDLENRIVAGARLAHWLMDPDPLSRCAESGMDNSPRFDSGVQLEAVDLNAFLSMECRTVAGFARALGRTADARSWSERSLEINRLINERLWSEEAGFYFDYDPTRRSRTGVFAVSGFLPLLCDAPVPQQVRRLAEHLDNPRTFSTPAPVASAVLTPNMNHPKDMWRGPAWMNTTWLVALGFERCGRRDIAARLRQQSLREVERWYLERGSIFEFYDEFGLTPPDELPRKGRFEPGSASHQAIHDYGWTATLYVDLVCEGSD